MSVLNVLIAFGIIAGFARIIQTFVGGYGFEVALIYVFLMTGMYALKDKED